MKVFETCKCGQWPIEEYGPMCPSCEMDARVDFVEAALNFLGEDEGNAEYLPVSLRFSGGFDGVCWRYAYESELVTEAEVVQAAAFKLQASVAS